MFVFQMNSCSHYGALYPWLTVLNPPSTTSSHNQEALHKLQVICPKKEGIWDVVRSRCNPSLCFQSLLCGPSLSVDSIAPLLESISKNTIWGLSLHLLCATRRGHYESSIEKLLDCCPQAIIAYANHHLQDQNMVCTDLNCLYPQVA